LANRNVVLGGCRGVVVDGASVKRRLCGLGNSCQSHKKLGSDLPVGVDTDDGNAFKATSWAIVPPNRRRPTSTPSAN
jgi:hypothetical protein